jgi:hypothetical protein
MSLQLLTPSPNKIVAIHNQETFFEAFFLQNGYIGFKGRSSSTSVRVS